MVFLALKLRLIGSFVVLFCSYAHYNKSILVKLEFIWSISQKEAYNRAALTADTDYQQCQLAVFFLGRQVNVLGASALKPKVVVTAGRCFFCVVAQLFV